MEQAPTNESGEKPGRPSQVEAQANLSLGDTLVLKDGTRILIKSIDDRGLDQSRIFRVEKRNTEGLATEDMSDRKIFTLFQNGIDHIEKAN
jgi:hypothetical protein